MAAVVTRSLARRVLAPLAALALAATLVGCSGDGGDQTTTPTTTDTATAQTDTQSTDAEATDPGTVADEPTAPPTATDAPETATPGEQISADASQGPVELNPDGTVSIGGTSSQGEAAATTAERLTSALGSPESRVDSEVCPTNPDLTWMAKYGQLTILAGTQAGGSSDTSAVVGWTVLNTSLDPDTNARDQIVLPADLDINESYADAKARFTDVTELESGGGWPMFITEVDGSRVYVTAAGPEESSPILTVQAGEGCGD